MPLYEYQCEACGQRFELIRKFSDPPVDVCAMCGKGPVMRLLSSPAIQFKGSGWYITDYARKGAKGEGAKGEGAKGEDGGKGQAGNTEGGKKDSSPAPSAASSDSGASSKADTAKDTTTKPASSGPAAPKSASGGKD
jgi:putative FmdB family regulatory protein